MEFLGPYCREIELSIEHLKNDTFTIAPLQNKVLKTGVLIELVKEKTVKEVVDIAFRLNPNLNSIGHSRLRSKFCRSYERWKKVRNLAGVKGYTLLNQLLEEPFSQQKTNCRRSDKDSKTKMVARKSSRVKKATEVYQAPEKVTRTPKHVQPKSTPSRRSFSRDIELYMECVEDELSPAQLKAIKEAQKEHEKANNLIKEVRAGNTLVPSSQPNTFTIVPPKSAAVPAKPPFVSKVHTPAIAPMEQDMGTQRGLPPPRPAQFLSKQLQEMKKTPGTKLSQDVILISDTTAAPTSSKMTLVNVPMAQFPGNAIPMQKMQNLITPPGAQQVYKFVSLPSNVPTNMVNNQFTLRPVLSVPSQQQPQLAFVGSQAIRGTSVVTTASQRKDLMPAPRSIGEELNKVGGAKSQHGQGDNQGSTVIHKTYLNSCNRSLSQNKYHSVHANHHFRRTKHLKKCTRCRVSCKPYSWKVRSHCARTSKLFNTSRTKQAYGRPRRSIIRGWYKKSKFKTRINKFDKGTVVPFVVDPNCNLEIEARTNNLKINCDKSGHLCEDSAGTFHIVKHENLTCNPKKPETTLTTCGDVKNGSQLSLEYAERIEVESSLPSNFESDAIESSHMKMPSCHRDKFEFEQAVVEIDSESLLKIKCNKVVEVVDCSREETDIIQTPVAEHVPVHDNKVIISAYQDSLKESLFKSKVRNRTDSKVEKVRTPFSELSNSNDVEDIRTLSARLVANSKKTRSDDEDDLCYEMFDGIGKLARLTEGNRSYVKQIKGIDFKMEKTKKKRRKSKSLHRLCKTLLDDYIPRSYGIVNMVTESAYLMSENPAMRTTDECLTVSEGKLSDITNISCGNVIYNSATVVESNLVDTNSNEIRETYTAEVQGCLNKLIEQVVMKEKKELDESFQDNFEQCKINKVKDCLDIVRDDAQERNYAVSTHDLAKEGLNEHLVETDFGEDSSNDIGKVMENDGKYKEPKVIKQKWYETVTTEDKLFIVLLCNQYGFTKISKDLQIPKTELLKLRRYVKKSKQFHSKVHEMSQKDVITGLTASTSLNQENDSVLKVYHPCMYKIAQTLCTTMNNCGDKFKEECRKLECDDNELDMATQGETSNQIINRGIKSDTTVASLFNASFDEPSLDAGEDADECDSMSDSGDLVIDFDNFENRILDENNKTRKEDDNEASVKTSSRLNKYSKSAQIENCDKLGVEKVILSAEYDMTDKRDKEELICHIKTDHCYEHLSTESVQTNNQSKTKGSGEALEDEDAIDNHNTVHNHLSDCLTYPDGTFQLFNGRNLTVYNAVSKDNLIEISKHLAEFGPKSTAKRYKIVEDHAQFFMCHTLSFSRNKTRPHLEDGIPESYESSNYFNELTCKMFPNVISLDNCSYSDRLDNVRLNRKSDPGTPDENVFDSQKEKKFAVQNSVKLNSNEESTNLNTENKERHELHPTLKDSSSKGHTVFTNDFLKYFRLNCLLVDMRKTPNEQLILKNQAAFDLIQTKNSMVTYNCNGKAKHRYKPEFQRQLMLLSCNVGIKAVSDYFDISMKTLNRWKISLCKALEQYSNNGDAHSDVAKVEKTKVKKRQRSNVLNARKRVILSRNLKMKLCKLSCVEGINEVCEKYNITRKLLRKWMTTFDFESQSSFDLTSGDLVELIEYGEYKQYVSNCHNPLNSKNADNEPPNSEEIDNDEQQMSRLQNILEKVNGGDDQNNSNGNGEKDVDAEQTLQMTYPNNMEVILDDDQELGSEKENDLKIADRPLVHNGIENNNVGETVENVETSTADGRAYSNNVKNRTLKKDFLNQNAMLMEVVSRDIVLSDSDNEEVVEILSWNVKNANDMEDKEKDIERPNKSENNTESGTDWVSSTSKKYDEDNTIKHDKEEEVKQQGVKLLDIEKEQEVSTDKVDETLNKSKCEQTEVGGLCNEHKNEDFVKYRLTGMLGSIVNCSGENTTGDACSNMIVGKGDNLDDIDNNMVCQEKDNMRKDNIHSGKPQFQSFCPVTIKDEPYDEEFDRIESGASHEKQISETGRDKYTEKLGKNDQVNKSGKDLKCDYIATGDNNGEEGKGFKGSEINQLGTGDGDSNKSQGHTFQSTSGSTNSGSQMTGQAHTSGNLPNIGLNINDMNSLSTENVQIVGPRDLIPGQEYILVDPRMFNSVSNSFQNLNPPTLLRPPSSAVNTVGSVRPRVQVRGLVTHVPKANEQPTPVHIVENRSLQVGTSQGIHFGSVSPLQSAMLQSASPLYGQQKKKISPKSKTVRSLLTGLPVQPRGVSNVTPMNDLTEQRFEQGERSFLNTGVNFGRVVVQSNASISPVKQGNTGLSQDVGQSAQIISTSCNTSVEGPPTLNTEKANEKTLTYTLKGVGSISSKEPIGCQVVRPNTPCPNTPSSSMEGTPVHDSKEKDKIHKQEQFSKYLSNADVLLEKERKLLQALLVQKSSKRESSAKLDTPSKTESKNIEKPGPAQSCNRINSLIQKMTNRVQKDSDDALLNVPVIDTNRPVTSDKEHTSKPASASEILFGELSSPKKKDIEREPLSKSSLVKSSLFCNRFESLNSGAKKELRKSPLVMREVDSSDEESSSSSSLRERSSSEETDSVVEEHEHVEGRIEQVDLSAKLKSLLSADIFNVIEPEKGDNSEDDDIIEMLAQPSGGSQSLSIDSNKKFTGPSRIFADNKSQGNETGSETTTSLKKTAINYSLNIKKKLGKLASIFSIVSLHKKYGVNPQTLSKWKAKYQDEEIAGLELTEEELKELADMSKIKKAMYGSNAQEYDIYVDNPEEDEEDNAPKKKIVGGENVDEHKGANVDKHKEEKDNVVKTDETKSVVSGSFEKSSLLPKKSGVIAEKSEKTTQNKVTMGTPLYITIDDDASDDVKQQLRQNLKNRRTAEHTWSNGAFIKSSENSFASVFGTDKSEGVHTDAKPQAISLNKSDTESASEKEYEEVKERDDDQRHSKLSRMLHQKTGASGNDIWEKTVYLCPDEGIFKYRYEKINSKEPQKTSNEKQTFSVLDSLFRSPDCSTTTIDLQESTKGNSVSDFSTQAETSRQKSNLPSNEVKENELQKVSKDDNSLAEEVVGDKDENVYSEGFKWTVVEEARKSGFEKTAKWYGISMTDIMKWHDSFLHGNKSKELITHDLASNTSESSSAVVDLTHDESTHSHSIQTPVRTKVNSNLSFERIQVKEGTITKPRFNTRPDSQPSTPIIPVVSPSNRIQRTRMGPNTIKYATPRVDPDQLQKFQADVQGDLGIMPKLMKKSNSRDGVEIASTWKQVQSVLNPEKLAERRYTLEFKQKIIAECERRGQKSVAKENRIPYNEISRWRLEAKKYNVLPTHQPSAFAKADSSKKAESSSSSKIMSTSSKKSLLEQDTSPTGKNESRSGIEQESLKIKIKLSTLSQPTPSITKKVTEQPVIQEPSIKEILKTTSHQKANESGKKSSPSKSTVISKANKNDSDAISKVGKIDSDKTVKKQSSTSGRNRSVERTEPGQIDEDADLRMEVINFCFDQGVLKTQKKYNVTRQSIIDLMKEYDELNKYAVDNYNKSHGLHSFKTKLVSREKTSVEVTSTATQPVIVKNLNDYIVTQEYMKTVVDYALKHGITAASRKYKRKTSTVRSWMNQFQREVKKKISVEQVAKEQELIANNVSVEEARKISNLEARKKKQLLEAEFRRHIIEFARQFGITAASRRFKKKAATVKSWMGHFMKSERDAKRLEETEIRNKQASGLESTITQNQMQSPISQGRLSVASDSHTQKSPSSSRQRTPPQSPISLWDQDFVIKPSSSKSPLKLTFSPRRKSSPVIVIGSSTEEDTMDDETNDIETDDEQDHVSGEYFEVAAWNLDISGEKSGSKQTDSSKTDESAVSKETIEDVIDLLSDEESPKKKSENEKSIKIDAITDKRPNDCSKSNSSLEKSFTDSTTEDCLITSMDEGNILELENASNKEILLKSETLKGIETTDDNITDVSLTQIKDLAETVVDGDEEKEKNTIPYEETVMFKLMTDELDIFMKNEAVVAKYNVPKKLDENRIEDKPLVVKENTDPKPMKKFKKYADAEIMENIEETYLFTGARVTRNAVGKELESVDDTLELQGNETNPESEVVCAVEQESLPGDKIQAEEKEPKNQETEKNVEDDHEINEDDVKEVLVSENENKDITAELPVPDIQKKGERSLFDILSSESETQKEACDTVAMTDDGTSDDKNDEMKPSFNLFGNLMKSFKVPIDMKSPSKSECQTENTPVVKVEIVKEQENNEKSEDLVKDRSERNLFDFICPEPELPKTPTKELSPQTQTSPRMQTRSIFRSEKAASLSPQKVSPLKISPLKVTPLKKPMFKFPKLALPVNFGNIAKLGMAKIKEEEKAKGENESKNDDDRKHEDSEKDVKSTGEDACSDINIKKSPAKELVQTENKSIKQIISAQDDVVMETFEELRQRLSKERAANKLVKEKAKVITETEAMDVDEIDGSGEISTSVTTAKTAIEIDSEMYENFTPQKIVLILDISKKHGVEFASTSFGLPVSVIVNWIIEKDRKQRKVALSVSLEEKLKALKKMRDGELTRDEVKEQYNLDDTTIQKWDSEISWMIEDKNVCDVLEKWKTVETVSNINFEECSKNLERRDSVVEKEVLEDQTKLPEVSFEKTEVMKQNKEIDSANTNDTEICNNTEEEITPVGNEAIPGKNVTEKAEKNDVSLTQEDQIDKKETDQSNISSINEKSEKNPAELSENTPVDLEIEPVTDENMDDTEMQMNKPSGETVTVESTTENNFEDPDSSGDQKDLPEILSFLKTTKPRDFTIEQKAMVVLLTEKYGGQLVNKKFGINTGTMYNWRHSSKHVRQYLNGQGYYFSKSKDNGNVKDKASEKVLPKEDNLITPSDFLPNRETRSSNVKAPVKVNPIADKTSIKTLPNEDNSNCLTSADFLPSRETRSTSDKKITETLNEETKKEMMKEPTVSKPEEPQKPKSQSRELGKEKDLIPHPKGYRIISPTKLPPVLKDIKKIQTKDYTLEQRVAIVKLVQMYGVRTVHKQFHIPTGSIWNWQHAKNVMDVLKKEEMVDSGSCGAQRNIDFSTDDNDEDGPVTIDTILDRVLIAAETSSHLSYDLDQRVDIVCLINHFGIDYFCEKVPQIPRGTLWNWRHNKQVSLLAEKRNAMIKMFMEQINKRQVKVGRDNVVSETVDKADLTQKWLKDVQVRRSMNVREDSVDRSKRKLDGNETSVNATSRKKPKLGPMFYKRSISNDRFRRSLSPSTVCSETSVHSDDFEEIFSDDELNTPSVISKRSGASSQTVQSSKTNKSQQKTSKGTAASGKMETGLVSQSNGLGNEKTETSSVPVHEILKFETGNCNRMMVCYKDLEKTVASNKHVRTDNLPQGVKRPSPTELTASQPPAKKKSQHVKVPDDSSLSGNWVPLDEYYYGTHEGDNSYTEEKGEYRFKCWYCSKMLYNNVRAMQHIQGHIDASKQQNIDLSDLTQCKHCYKQFDTPFEMQTHVEKVHLSNKVLMCRICEKDFPSQVQLSVHMKSNHQACEMPYVCHLCNFRSSMYSDVVDHFKKKHDSSHYMLCLYCLRTFEVKFVSQGWGQTQTYYGHLLKHQTKSATKKCVVCRLTFFNTQDVKNHRKNCHVGNFKDVKVIQGGKVDGSQKQRKGPNLKSLNAPSVSRIQDYGEIIFPAEASSNNCVECKMVMSSTDHYKKYVHCSMCRFATSCSVAYANHMMGFHSGQMSSLNLNIPWERPMKNVMYCACGYNSKFGNKIANHLVYCGKWTSYSTRRTQAEAVSSHTADSEREGSILGMLGLVQKSSVTTIEDSDEIISRPKTDKKPKIESTRKVEKLDAKDTNKIAISKLKTDDKPVAKDQADRTDTKVSEDTKDSKHNLKKEEDAGAKQSDTNIKKLKLKCPIDTIPDDTLDKDKITDVDYGKIEAEIIDLDADDEEVNMNLKNEEKDSNNVVKVGNDPETVDEPKKEIETETKENDSEAPTMNEGKVTKEGEEVTDQETKDEPDVKEISEADGISESEEKEIISELIEDDDPENTNDDGKVEEEMDTETDHKVDEPDESLENIEEMETVDEADNEMEQECSGKASKEDEKQFSETGEEMISKVKENIPDTETKDTLENVPGDDEEMVEEIKETVTGTEENIDEDDSKEKELDKMEQEQEITESSNVKEVATIEKKENEPKEEETPKEENEPKDQEKVTEDESVAEKETEDKREKSVDSSGDHGSFSDQKSQEPSRDSSERHSSERHSQERQRDSTDRHSSERRESAERHHSGNRDDRDRSKYDDRSRHDDRHRHDNRSYGSNRSDSQHGNRSNYDQNRDRSSSYDQNRDRSYNRDRDYNRNKDYSRHSDSRSGHGYQDNRGYGGQGHRDNQGQYGGNHGNRGGHHYQDRNRGGNNQDRSYNRNHQNRGGYNQNYRGNYNRGGYY